MVARFVVRGGTTSEEVSNSGTGEVTKRFEFARNGEGLIAGSRDKGSKSSCIGVASRGGVRTDFHGLSDEGKGSGTGAARTLAHGLDGPMVAARDGVGGAFGEDGSASPHPARLSLLISSPSWLDGGVDRLLKSFVTPS